MVFYMDRKMKAEQKREQNTNNVNQNQYLI